MKRITAATIILGAIVGFAIGWTPQTKAARNSGGTYSLPLPAVQAGNIVQPSWANTTLNDIGTELTNSVDRAGRGGMTAPLRLSNGTSSLPSMAFVSEAGSGIYRASSHDVRMQINGTTVEDWTATGVTFPFGVVATQATTDGNGIASTGDGNGLGGLFHAGPGNDGIQAYGGSGGAHNGVLGAALGEGGIGVKGLGYTSGPGVFGGGGAAGVGGLFYGGADNDGIQAYGGSGGAHNGILGAALGTGGTGVTGAGGAGGTGVYGVGGTGGTGISGLGGGGGVGVVAIGGADGGMGLSASAGIAATASVPRNAAQLTNGNLAMLGANPDFDAGFINTLTPKNIVKSWFFISTGGGATQSVSAGFNVNVAATCSAMSLRVSFASPMSGLTAAVCSTSGPDFISVSSQTSYVDIVETNRSGTQLDICGVIASNIYCIVMGAQ